MKIPLDKVREIQELRYILGYPNPKASYVDSRIAQLRSLEVEYVILEGRSRIGRLNVLGKGYRSIVILVEVDGNLAAAKIRRVDSPRKTVVREAELLTIANKVSVGPKLYGFTHDILLMEYIPGLNLREHVAETQNLKGIRSTVRKLLEQAYSLDRRGLDHGELARTGKHIIVKPTGEPVIIDFESASTSRRPRNLTSIVQYLVFRLPSATGRELFKLDTGKLLEALRRYKTRMDRESYRRITGILNL